MSKFLSILFICVGIFFITSCSVGPTQYSTSEATVNVVEGEIDVELGREFTISFDMPVSTASINNNSFFVVPAERTRTAGLNREALDTAVCNPAYAVDGTITCEETSSGCGSACTLDLGGVLAHDTEYVLCITSGIAFCDENIHGFFAGMMTAFETEAEATQEPEPEPEPEPEAPSLYSVGGTVSGLTGTLVLQNNAGDDLTITADGTFAFATELNDGLAYVVTVLTQPNEQVCTVSNGTGTISSADVTNVTLACTTNVYTVSGTVSGLSGTVVLQNSEGEEITVNADGSFSFTTEQLDGDDYAITVLTHPTSPDQTCTVSSGTGTINSADVTNVSVVCSTDTYLVSGTVSGLVGTVTLQNNGGNNLSKSSDGGFTFSTEVADGAGYAVTVLTQPTSPNQTCTVSNGNGTIDGANVTNVSVVCATETYSVGGTVTGLVGTLVLQNNGGDNLTIEAADSFTFSTELADESGYVVSVLTDPTNQTCTVTSAAGTLAGANVTNVAVTCENNQWYQEAYIKAANTGAGDRFSVVAIEGDTLVVGAYLEDSNQTTITNGTTASADNSAADAGAAYVYKRTGTTWAQEAYLKAANAEAGDYYGYSVDISGDTIVIGAFMEDSNQTTITNGTTASADNSAASAGAAYVYKRTGTNWAQEAYLKAANANAGDYYGMSVAIDGDTIVVGAGQEQSNQNTITNGATASADNSITFGGAAYVYVRTGATWAQQAYIKPPNMGAQDQFAWDVAIDGDTIVAAAEPEDNEQYTITNGPTVIGDDNALGSSGAVYVFKRTGTNWAQEAYIKAANADLDDNFGSTVSIDVDTIAVTAKQEDSNQTTITNGTTASSDDSLLNAGAVYVYKRTGTNWAQEAYIKAANAEAGDRFGYEQTAIRGNLLVVGTYGEDSNQTTITNGATASADNSASAAGAAYVYRRTGASWAQEAYIKAVNSEASDWFGFWVAVDGDTIAVGSYEDSNQTTITNGPTASSNNSASTAGAVYIYRYQVVD